MDFSENIISIFFHLYFFKLQFILLQYQIQLNLSISFFKKSEERTPLERFSACGGSLRRLNSLSPQALDHLANVTSLVNKPSLELRSSAERFLFNRRTFLLNDSLHALRTDHRLQIKILSG